MYYEFYRGYTRDPWMELQAQSVELCRHLLVADGWMWVFINKIHIHKGVGSKTQDPKEGFFYVTKRGI